MGKTEKAQMSEKYIGKKQECLATEPFSLFTYLFPLGARSAIGLFLASCSQPLWFLDTSLVQWPF